MRTVLILAASCIFLYSCNKDYKCECVSDNQNDTTSSETFQVNSIRKSDARDKCASYQNQVNSSLKKNLTCTLK